MLLILITIALELILSLVDLLLFLDRSYYCFNQISFNAALPCSITGLTGVLSATIITTLDKVLQYTAVANTDEVYVITGDRHYLEVGENVFVDGNPSEEVGGVVFDEYDDLLLLIV